VDSFVAGINAYNRRVGLAITPWTRNDVVAVAALIGVVFGAGGGDEVRSAQLLLALQARLGAASGRAVWDDLRQLDDPDAFTAHRGRDYAWSATSAGGDVVDEVVEVLCGDHEHYRYRGPAARCRPSTPAR
jgi:acyl-homoserine lactone acylase PvdQ